MLFTNIPVLINEKYPIFEIENAHLFIYLSTVIIVRVPIIKIPVFFYIGQREIGTVYRVIILLSLIFIV